MESSCQRIKHCPVARVTASFCCGCCAYCSEAPCAGFRHFKIALTGPNANGGTELYCSGIEVRFCVNRGHCTRAETLPEWIWFVTYFFLNVHVQFFGSVCDCVRCLAVVESQKSEADKEADMAEVAAKEKQEAVQAELAEKNIKGTAQGLNDHASAEAGGMDGENTKTRDAILDTHDGRPVPNDFVHYDDVEVSLIASLKANGTAGRPCDPGLHFYGFALAELRRQSLSSCQTTWMWQRAGS